MRAMLAGLALVAVWTAGASAKETALQNATVDMRAKSCTVSSPKPLFAGTVLFTVRNRSGQPRRFAIAGARTAFVGPGRRTSLAALLRAGMLRYSCSRQGRRGTQLGTLAVAAHERDTRPKARIVVRDGLFYDRASGERFVPRGTNYIRLAPQTDSAGNTFDHHSTFDVGRYDGTRADAALARMAASGYNVVRVFFSPVCLDRCLGDPSTGGLRSAYLANAADFVTRAKAHGLQVLITIDGPPAGTTWSGRVHSNCCDRYAGMTQWILPRESLDAFRDFYPAVVLALLDAGMPADGVFAYSLINEVFFDGDKPPFSLSSGTRTTANGHTYDLGSPADRRRMLEEGLVYWVDEITEAIHDVLPTALVTIGAFHAHEPHPARPGDPRLIYTNALLARSKLDFVSLHPYPGVGLSFQQFVENYGLTGAEAKPVVMGEFGAFKFAYGSAEQAATALADWQRQSCAHGFDGWLLWTWDTEEQPELWNALSADGAIERALAPRTRPDPCA